MALKKFHKEVATEETVLSEKLTKYYGKQRGVIELSFAVRKGEIFGYLGPNGAGKTTTIRLLLNFIFPTSGKAYVFGLDTVKDSLKIRQNVGYVPGEVHLYPKMTGEELINYFARFRPDKPPVLKDKLVKRLDLDLKPRVKEYSHGNKQKLAVVLAFMHDPELLILDEPTNGLDPIVQQEFYLLLKEFKEQGKTIFLSSHNLPEVEKACDRIGIIKEGQIVAEESLETIREKEVRNVEVVFDEDVAPDFFNLPGVYLASHHNRTFHLKVKGDINPIIGLLSRFKVKDLQFAHASLEEVFLEFYEKEKNEL